MEIKEKKETDCRLPFRNQEFKEEVKETRWGLYW